MIKELSLLIVNDQADVEMSVHFCPFDKEVSFSICNTNQSVHAGCNQFTLQTMHDIKIIADFLNSALEAESELLGM
jgi:hypothetical protein